MTAAMVTHTAHELATAFDRWMRIQTRIANGTYPELEDLNDLWNAVVDSYERYVEALGGAHGGQGEAAHGGHPVPGVAAVGERDGEAEAAGAAPARPSPVPGM